MNDQTSKKEFNHAVKPEIPTPKIEYSHDEVLERLSVLGKLSKNGYEANEVSKFKEGYDSRIASNDDNRLKKDVLYNLARSGRGLHMEGNHSDLTNNRNITDQSDRNKIMEWMSEFYNQHQSIKHDMDKAVEKDKPDDYIKE